MKQRRDEDDGWVACKGNTDLPLLRVGRWVVEFDDEGKPLRMRPVTDESRGQ